MHQPRTAASLVAAFVAARFHMDYLLESTPHNALPSRPSPLGIIRKRLPEDKARHSSSLLGRTSGDDEDDAL